MAHPQMDATIFQTNVSLAGHVPSARERRCLVFYMERNPAADQPGMFKVHG